MGDVGSAHESGVYDFVWKLIGGFATIVSLGATALALWVKDMRDQLHRKIDKVDQDSATAISEVMKELHRVETERQEGDRRLWERINADTVQNGNARTNDAHLYATKDDLKSLAAEIKEAIHDRGPVRDREK